MIKILQEKSFDPRIHNNPIIRESQTDFNNFVKI